MTSIPESLLIVWTTPLYAFVIGIEMVLSHWEHRRLYSFWGVVQNLYLTVLNAGLDLLVRGLYVGILLYAHKHRVGEISQPWLYWTALVLLEDFVYYWLHRFDHVCRLFWAVHVTHHSSEEFNLTTGFRSSVFQPLYRFVYFIPLAWLGFRAEDILLTYSATQIWGILVHTQYVGKLGWLEWILVTPSHHRVHHASNIQYLDRNMGMFLIVWDRLFGTFADEDPDEPVRYGLTTNLTSQSPGNLVFHEWGKLIEDLRKPGPLAQKVSYLFQPPGWSHDGSSQTADQLRQELLPKTDKSLKNSREAVFFGELTE
jgi:sterol desaturase/sphingolipid hydroxylase (fatty acid hydroxylase superfamily)